MSLARNDSRRHHQADDLQLPFPSSTIFAIPSYSVSPNPSNIDSPDYQTTADFYHHSGDSTPSEHYILSPHASPYMTTTPTQNPPIRVQSSTPNPRPSQTSNHDLPSMHNNFSGSGTNWEFANTYHLAPQYQQHYSVPAHRRHKRFSSGSSVGSVGPDSPYTQTIAYPHIVDTDSVSGLSPQLEVYEGAYSSGHYPKIPSGTSYHSYENLQQPLHDFNNPAYNADTLMATQSALKQATMGQNGTDAPDGNPCPKNPYGDGYDEGSIEHRNNVPKFSRTMTDVYADELFEPPSSSQPVPVMSQAHHATTQGQNTLLSPYSAVFSERWSEANQEHMSQRSNSPNSNISREKSPFRAGSEYLSDGYSTGASNAQSPATRLNSAAQMRQQAKAESDALVLAQHQPRGEDLVTPKTISPKEVALDYNETEEDAKMPLFPQENGQKRLKQPNQANIKQERDHATSAIADRQFASIYPSAPAVTQSGSSYQFMPPQMSGSTQVPQQYPFLARRQSSIRSTSDSVPEFPAHLTSMDSTRSESSQTENNTFHGLPSSLPSSQQSQQSQDSSSSIRDIQRPQNTAADSGTYTCTATSCASRFDTAAKLQKHRRDEHRQPSPPRTPNTPTTPYAPTSSTQTPTSATFPSGSSATNRNNQAGPHKCERTNPSTGKPCNTIFSRSYDLTRHEDTIHNNRKQKVRCQFCTEDKTFSRNDALTRHMRVVHPDIDFPGKTRRRGG